MPRVVVLNERREVLFVRHNYRGPRRELFWVIPGGDRERGESSRDAAVREVLEETGVRVEIRRLLWHVEETLENGDLRWNSYFLGVPVGGTLRVGTDPESGPEAQVIDDARYFSRRETALLERVYPEVMRSTFWRLLDDGHISLASEENPVYRVRPSEGFGR